MSCGNRFVCGMRRFDKYKTSSDRPNNPTLHNENQQKLNQLLQEREELNKQLYPPPSHSTSELSHSIIPSIPITYNTTQIPSNSCYTPWKTPSTQ
jgi:hypothetical protein